MTITYSNREPCICFDILVIGDRYYLRGITKSITILKPKNNCGALRNLLTSVQFKTCKYPWRSVTFSNFIKSNTPPWVLFRLYKMVPNRAKRLKYYLILYQFVLCLFPFSVPVIIFEKREITTPDNLIVNSNEMTNIPLERNLPETGLM